MLDRQADSFEFGAAASFDIRSGGGSQTYWSSLAMIFGLICVALDWMHEPPGTAWAQRAGRTALHWFGVLIAIEPVYVFIGAGRLADTSTGLLNGTILALGTFTSGVHTNWRLVVIGAALGLGTVAVAHIEQYLWIVFAWWPPSASSSSARAGVAAATALRKGRMRRIRPARCRNLASCKINGLRPRDCSTAVPVPPPTPPANPFSARSRRPNFLVVFEGCSGEAPHCAHADTAEIRSLRADILRTC